MFRFGKKFGKTQAWIKSIWTYGFVFGPYSVLIHRLVCSTQFGFRTFTLTITKEVWEKTKFTPNYKEIGKNKTLEMLPFENNSHQWKVNTTFKDRNYKRNNWSTCNLNPSKGNKELSSVLSALGENAHKIVHISFQANGKRRMNYVEFNMRSERQTHFSFSSYDD